MKILSQGHDGGGFTLEERLSYRTTINKYVIQNMQDLIQGTLLLHIEISPENKAAVDKISTFMISEDLELSPEIISNIKTLWRDKGIQQAYNQPRDLSIQGINLPDSTEYFYNNILDSLLDPNYIPSVDDVIRSRAKTVTVVQQEFLYKENLFRMIDVGGQRSERKKWLHVFADIDAFIYCVSLSEYDVFLREDISKNRMEDAFEEFENLCNKKILKKISTILFLNKNDLFKEKIQKVDLKICFPDYTGGCDYTNALTYIKQKFTKIFNDSNQPEVATRNLYIYDTVCIASDIMDNVMTSLKKIFFTFHVAAHFSGI